MKPRREELEQKIRELEALLAEQRQQVDWLRPACVDPESRLKASGFDSHGSRKDPRPEIEKAKRAGKALRVTEEKYRLLFHGDPNPLFIADQDGRILEANSAASSVSQYGRDELLHMSFFDLLDPDEEDRFRGEMDHCLPDESVFVPRLLARKKDGENYFIHAHARRGRFKDLKGGGLGDAMIIRVDDITEQLEREAQLVQASKMCTLGEMAMGVVHELRQPLNVIQVGADLLAKMVKKGQPISEEQLSKIGHNLAEQVARATRIADHLRDFGRKTRLEKSPTDINESIRSVFTMVGRQLELRDIEVVLLLDEALPEILAARNELEQVFLNLVINARDAMDGNEEGKIRRLTITTGQEGGKITAFVSDTGKGMPPYVQKRVFEPFFTTKEEGRGTGLGLSICQRLVKDFGGDITVDSSPDEGTTFKISFPAAG